MLRRARFKIRRQDSERGQIGTVGLDTAFRDGGDRLAGLLRSGVDLVVDIREVARVDDTPQAPLQQAIETAGRALPIWAKLQTAGPQTYIETWSGPGRQKALSAG